jgi:phytoene synthase
MSEQGVEVTQGVGIGDAFRYCADLVREQNKDRFLSSLFAPGDARLYLFALYAFDIETARVRDLVSDPMAGNIRLQWWREAMDGLRPEETAAHPVLTALLCAAQIAGADRAPLTRIIEARQQELFGGPEAEAASAVFLMAANLLAGKDRKGADAIAAAAEDAGRASTLLHDPADPDAARESYRAFRDKSVSLPKKVLPAFLPMALVALRIARGETSQFRRQLALMRAAWLEFPKF